VKNVDSDEDIRQTLRGLFALIHLRDGQAAIHNLGRDEMRAKIDKILEDRRLREAVAVAIKEGQFSRIRNLGTLLEAYDIL
jgi:hypothetical protein